MPLTVIDHVLLDHERIRTLLDRARDAAPEDRGSAAADLVDVVVRHETAEAALVRPRTRETRDGPPVAWSLDQQERTIGRLLATLETIDARDEVSYLDVVERIRRALLHHFAAEESAEHPRLEGEFCEQQLVDLGRRFVRVTHLELPAESPLGAAAVGEHEAEATGAFARARDVVRIALTT